MKKEEINIGTARINGINKTPYLWEQEQYFAWDITFTESPTIILKNLAFIKMGKNEENAMKFYNRIRKNFKRSRIDDSDRIALIFQKEGNVLAIGRIGRDMWIDVNDKFSIKTFQELNISFNSLKVF